MSDLTIKKIEQSKEDRKSLYLDFLKNVETYKPFLKLEEKAFKDGALNENSPPQAAGYLKNMERPKGRGIKPQLRNKKTKELMALSISIVTKCEPCMEWHLDQALQAGATDEEVYETIDVAIEMGGGPASAYARFVLRALEYYKEIKG
jgi:AhpD family alkylhydroperoxidase